MDLIRYNREPLKSWHYLAPCLSGSLIDYHTDALVNNDNTKYYNYVILGKGGIIAVMVRARGSERGNACSFIRTLP